MSLGVYIGCTKGGLWVTVGSHYRGPGWRWVVEVDGDKP